MRDEQIRIGDRVKVVFWPCCDLGETDNVHTVHGFTPWEPGCCYSCGYEFRGDSGPDVLVDEHPGAGRVPLAWVRKIHPDEQVEREVTKHEEPISA